MKSYRSVISAMVLLTAVWCSAAAQSLDSALAFYPMQQGNYWLYDFQKITVTRYYKAVQIAGDTVMPDGKTYAVFVETNLSSHTVQLTYRRIDSTTACIYEWDSVRVREHGIDSLRGNPPVMYYAALRYPHLMIPDTILGVPTVSKYFSGISFTPVRTYAFGFGLVHQFLDDRYWGEYTTLVYARINGIEHGTAVSVPRTASPPTRFVLSQNYPNPFNPSTTISYSLPIPAIVSLRVFNTLGQEVVLLVDEREEAGYHQVGWYAAHVPSGIYFYRLQVGESVQTRKMVVVK